MPRGLGVGLVLVTLVAAGALALGGLLYRQNLRLSAQLKAVSDTLSQQQTRVSRLADRQSSPQRRWLEDASQTPPGAPWAAPEGETGRRGGRANQPEAKAGQAGRMFQQEIHRREEAGEDMSQLRAQADRIRALFQQGQVDEARQLMERMRARFQSQAGAGGGKQDQTKGRQGKQASKQTQKSAGTGAAKKPSTASRTGRQSSPRPPRRMDARPMPPEALAFMQRFGGPPGARGPGGMNQGRGGEQRDRTALIQNERLAVRLDPRDASFRIYDKLTRKTWTQVVPAKPFGLQSAGDRQGDRLAGELQAEIPCRFELSLGEGITDLVLTLEPTDVFAEEESRQVTLRYPYPFRQDVAGQVALPLIESPGSFARPPLAGEWLHPGEHLSAPWIGLCSKAAGLLCVVRPAPNWQSALRLTKSGKGKAATTSLAPAWRNQEGVVDGKLSVIYHVTSGASYAKMQEAYERLLVAPVEREL